MCASLFSKKELIYCSIFNRIVKRAGKKQYA